MRKARVATGLALGCLFVLGAATTAWSAPPPSVSKMLELRPKQDSVVCSTPTADEERLCKVEQIQNKRMGSGWVLRDPQGKILRRFFNSRFTSDKDGTRMDLWSYYKDGVEVYREWSTKNGERPDQYRWFNAGGMKWGVDENRDGKIDAWKMISPEEVSQEVLQAVVTHDNHRIQALLISDAEIKMLELPSAEASRIRGLRSGAAAKFQAALSKIGSLDAKTHWLHLETSAPQCLPAEQTGARQDILKHANGTILYEANGKNDWLQTGEMIQVGMAWRLVDAPTPGAPVMTTDEPGTVGTGGLQTAVEDKETEALLMQLKKLDEEGKTLDNRGGPNPEVVRFNLKRADLLEKIEAKSKPDQRDPWVRQVADCLSTAAQCSAQGDKGAYDRLLRLEEQIAGSMPGSSLAGYVTFRAISADYAIRLASAKGTEFEGIQKWWLETLAKFVQTYAKAEDAADALQQLGMVSELMGKETEAKNWYRKLTKDFADKPVAVKAQGAIARMELEGKPLDLAGPILGSGTAFDISRLRGKVVAVYYWASWNGQCVGDFAKLKMLLDTYGSKGFEVVGINLDTTADEATSFVKRAQAPGYQLFKEGGLDSPMATQYGIMVLPNLFLVGKDGKVLSRSVQVGNLEEELKKQLK
jgi:hypothetical protein